MHLTWKHQAGFPYPTSDIWALLACFSLVAFGNCQNSEFVVCRKHQHFEISFHSDSEQPFFFFFCSSPFSFYFPLLFSLNFSQTGNPSELPRAVPAGGLGVCLGSVLVFGGEVFLHRCKWRKPRSVVRGRFLVWLPSSRKRWQAATEPRRWPGRKPDRFTMKICLAG